MRPVTRDELQTPMRDGPADEFALGHVPDAIDVPLGEVSRAALEGEDGEIPQTDRFRSS